MRKHSRPSWSRSAGAPSRDGRKEPLDTTAFTANMVKSIKIALIRHLIKTMPSLTPPPSLTDHNAAEFSRIRMQSIFKGF